MPAVEECVSVSQTGLSHERWSAEGEAVPGRAQAEGDPTQCVFSSGMHSPVGDEHGAAETWAGSSWIPPGAKLGTEGEGHWRRPFSICSRCQEAGTATHSVDGTVGGEATGGAGRGQEGLLVSSGR